MHLIFFIHVINIMLTQCMDTLWLKMAHQYANHVALHSLSNTYSKSAENRKNKEKNSA